MRFTYYTLILQLCFEPKTFYKYPISTECRITLIFTYTHTHHTRTRTHTHIYVCVCVYIYKRIEGQTLASCSIWN